VGGWGRDEEGGRWRIGSGEMGRERVRDG